MTRRGALAALALAALIAAGCSDGDASPPSSPRTTTVTAITATTVTTAISVTSVTSATSATSVTSVTSASSAAESSGVPATESTAVPATASVPRPQPQVLTLDLVDRTRGTHAAGELAASRVRAVTTTVYLPAFDGTPAPLIVLAHGFNGHPDKFTELASAWTDAGFVVAVPKFPLTNDEVAAPQLDDLDQQSVDVDFVIDSMLARSAAPSGSVSGRVDADHIGLYGLSLGSLTVWGTLLRGCCPDRIDAVVQSDGASTADAQLLADAGIPVMLAHSDTDGVFPYAGIRAELRALKRPKYLLSLHGAVHATVGENTPTPADEASTVFWRRHLAGEAGTRFPDSIRIDGVTSFEARP